MKHSLFRRWLCCAAVAGLGVTSPHLFAQSPYPNKPLRLVVTFPTGGAPDILARLFSEKAQLGQPVVVDNKPGAGGNIGADFVAKQPADGYTIVMGAVATHAINPTLFTKMPYDPVKDFAPVCLYATMPMIMVANAQLPVKNVPELIALAKAKPNTISFASSGSGGAPHLVGELFKSVTGAPIQHVPYKGSAPGAADVAGGQVQLM